MTAMWRTRGATSITTGFVTYLLSRARTRIVRGPRMVAIRAATAAIRSATWFAMCTPTGKTTRLEASHHADCRHDEHDDEGEQAEARDLKPRSVQLAQHGCGDR